MLTGLDPLLICTGYRRGNDVLDDVPALSEDLERVTPIYEEHSGWQVDVSACKRLSDLPIPARKYIARLEQLAGVPIEIVSVGPDRAATISLAPAFV